MKNRIDLRNVSTAAMTYIDTCARIRNVTRQDLMRRMLDVIAQDQLIGGIMDDEARRTDKRNGEHRYRGLS